MTPYLILHKVRGEPAFDVAHQMECPHCNNPKEPPNADWEHQNSCDECDGEGHWWIVSTSGHRAYPAWACSLEGLHVGWSPTGQRQPTPLEIHPQDLDWNNYPDHYRQPSKTFKPTSLLDSVMAVLCRAKEPLKRRV